MIRIDDEEYCLSEAVDPKTNEIIHMIPVFTFKINSPDRTVEADSSPIAMNRT